MRLENSCPRNKFFSLIFVEKLYYSVRNLILRKLSLRAMLCLRESILNMKTYDRDTTMEEWCNECFSIIRMKENVRSDKAENIFSSWYIHSARERNLFMRGSLSKSTMFQGGGDRCLRRPPRRIVICALTKQSLSYNVMRDEITIDVYFLDSRFFRAS